MLDSDSPKEGNNNSKGRDKCLQASNIKFTLSGGSVHSELLVAEAVLDAKGKKKHSPKFLFFQWALGWDVVSGKLDIL